MDAMARTPAPPYYAVIFTSRRTDVDAEGYAAMAERLEALAREQPGYLGLESVRNAQGVGITVSYWRDEAAIRRWHAVNEHRAAQEMGYRRWYAALQVRVCRLERAYGFTAPSAVAPTQAPVHEADGAAHETPPVEVVRRWIERFNAADAAGLADLYHEDAVNHQVTQAPVAGREAIRAMFEREFAAAAMTCIPEAIHDAGRTAILEWRDPLGLRGCGFFTVDAGRIRFQRGYWDKLTFLKLHNLPLDTQEGDDAHAG